MLTCKRCKGGGRAPRIGEALQEIECWICRGKGVLPPPDTLAIRGRLLNRGGGLRSAMPTLPHKVALGLVGKPGPWGLVPMTVEEASASWQQTVDGRRTMYVWKQAHMKLSGYNKRKNSVGIHGTINYDPYIGQLDHIVNKVVEELR